MREWLTRQSAFFWIGVIGLLATGSVHAFVYWYTGEHITDRFNFYLVWLIFLVLNFIRK